ncbi:MAG: hypothetical protein HYU69_11095 [Bacteroidetes bacterium]|nr:hypothetical protein [Bacteroidota bacterium]
MKNNKRIKGRIKIKTKTTQTSKIVKGKKALKASGKIDHEFNSYRNFDLFEDVFRLW